MNTVAFSVEVLQDSPLFSCVHIYIYIYIDYHLNLDCELINITIVNEEMNLL